MSATKPFQKNQGKRRLAVCVATLLVTGGAALALEQVLVKTEIYVMPKKGGLGKPVAVVHKNEKLTVLADEVDWLKVRTDPGVEGYVKTGALSGKTFRAGDA